MRFHETITITPMTRELLHDFYKSFVPDSIILADRDTCDPYIYDAAEVDREYYENTAIRDRMDFAVLLNGKLIGDVGLKHIDYDRKECELMIHLTNDSVKDKGYGTQAEKLMIQYAFDVLGMETILADSIHKNTRSQHVLEKIGFQYIGEDKMYKYYKLPSYIYQYGIIENGRSQNAGNNNQNF